MALVEHGLEGLYPDPQVVAPIKVGRREHVRQAREEALAERREDAAFLQSESVRGALQYFAATLPQRVKIGVTDPSSDKPMNLVVSFNTRKSLLSLGLQWNTMVVGVQDTPEGKILTVNGRSVPKHEDLISAFGKGTDVPYSRVYELGGTREGRRDLMSERLLLGRNKIKLPKARRRWFSR